MNKDLMFSSATDLWATPQSFFDALNAEFGFEVDVCGLPENAKCKKYYTPEDNGLAQPWEGVCWVQSAVWPRDWEMGAKSGRIGEKCNGSNASSSTDGYKVVSQIHIRKGRDSVYRGAAKIWGSQKQRAVSEHGGSFSPAGRGSVRWIWNRPPLSGSRWPRR